MTEVACWAHARRKFYDAQDSDEQRATQTLSMIAQLCAVEREAKEADDAARFELRQSRSVWSLIASCERHQVDPQRYLTSVLAKIAQTPREELGQFLPDNWKNEEAPETTPDK